MTRRVLAALAALPLLTAPAGQANTPQHRYEGGCGFSTAAESDDPDPARSGTVYAVVSAVDHTTGSPSPGTPITVSCEIRVHGVSRGFVLSASGATAAAGVATLRFPAGTSAEDAVVCAHVVVGADSYVDCGVHVDDDPVCVLLRRAGHEIATELGRPDLLEVTEEGDVYVAGRRRVRCSPPPA